MDTRFTKLFRRGLVVSCQASEGEPFYETKMLVAMARAALLGGAVGLRVNGPEVTAGAHAAVPLPIIAIQKRMLPDGRICITPTFEDAKALAAAGAECIAVDATPRERPGGASAADLIRRIREELGCAVMADISTFEEGMAAARAGADAVASTLSGYTPQSPKTEAPDLELVRRLAAESGKPVVAEGRYNTPALAADAIRAGAWAVVVGTAITKPQWVAEQFARSLETAIKGL